MEHRVMRMRRLCLAISAAVALTPGAAGAADPTTTDTLVRPGSVELRDGTGARIGIPGNALVTADPNNAAYQGVVAMTPGTTYAAARSLGFICTTAGTVTLTMADASTIAIGLTASAALQTLPLAVTKVVLGTAVGSFWNLK